MSKEIFLLKFLKVKLNNHQLPQIIKFFIGCATQDQITKVVQSYNHSDDVTIDRFTEDKLIGIIGLLKTINRITIRHISILPEFKRKNIGSSILSYVENQYNIC